MEFVTAAKYKNQTRHLYCTAFPREERVPLFFLFHRARKPQNSFEAVLEGQEYIGLVYTIVQSNRVYVFYLAVAEEKRGQGYGSRILKAICRRYPKHTVLLAIEDTADTQAPNLKQRFCRLRFYEANGFLKLGIRFCESGVGYELLGTKADVTKTDFLFLMREYLGDFLFRRMYRDR